MPLSSDSGLFRVFSMKMLRSSVEEKLGLEKNSLKPYKAALEALVHRATAAESSPPAEKRRLEDVSNVGSPTANTTPVKKKSKKRGSSHEHDVKDARRKSKTDAKPEKESVRVFF